MSFFEFFLLLACVVVFFNGFILPWMNLKRLRALEIKVAHLSSLVAEAKPQADFDTNNTEIYGPPVAPPIQEKTAKWSNKIGKKAQISDKNDHKPSEANSPSQAQNIPKMGKPWYKGLEEQFAAKLPVWLGAIAIALAGFYLVKYSIDHDLLSPGLRVIMGGLLAIALLIGAHLVFARPEIANGTRIAQALAGAGISVAYVVVFAATQLYGLISTGLGFAGMAVVTAFALLLTLRHGPPVAFLGLLGGFLTPALLNDGGGSALTLFVYLYFTASALMIIARKQKIWWLNLLTLAGAILWVLIWLFSGYQSGDSIWLALFLMGISATIVATTSQRFDEESSLNWRDSSKLTVLVNYLGLATPIFLMGLIAGHAGFGMLEWGLFMLLSMAAVVLAWFKEQLYQFAPILAMAVSIVMLAFWGGASAWEVFIVIAGFALIFLGSSLTLIFKGSSPLLWSIMLCSSALAYYLVAYFKLHEPALASDLPRFWGALACVLAGGAVFCLYQMQKKWHDHKAFDAIQAIFASIATAFIALGFGIELDREFLSFAIAAEMLALAWINQRLRLKVLRVLIVALALLFAFLLMPQAILLAQLILYSLIEYQIQLQTSLPIVDWPLFQLGGPALMFLGSSYMLRQESDDRLVRVLEVCSIGLLCVMGYYLIRQWIHQDENILVVQASFFERGVITNGLFIGGLVCFWLGGRYGRTAIAKTGFALFSMAAFRVVYFDMILHNAILVEQDVTGVLLFNSLLLPFGLPLIWGYLGRHDLRDLLHDKVGKMRFVFPGFMLAVLFCLITFNTRFAFHGTDLSSGLLTNMEIYSYSVSWLLLGIALLVVGIILQKRSLPIASLAIILITVTKVFLYDASELEGLYRVFSFFGLGISLLGLSAFYSRYVFKRALK